MNRGNKRPDGGMGVTPPGAATQKPFATYDADYGTDMSADTSTKTSADTSTDTSADTSADFRADFSANFSVMSEDPQWPSVAPKI